VSSYYIRVAGDTGSKERNEVILSLMAGNTGVLIDHPSNDCGGGGGGGGGGTAATQNKKMEPPPSSSVSRPPSSPVADLTPDEDAATRHFMALVNEWRAARGFDPISTSSAVKFLMARKFSVDRALSLYQQHEVMRVTEGLSVFDPTRSPLREELRTEKFTILPSKDDNGATLALFNAHKHDPSVVDHRTTLQGVVYQLDVALEQVRSCLKTCNAR
jgi:hypothetical protein